MILENGSFIYDINSCREPYIIDLKTGGKCTIHGTIACPDEITRGDLERAWEHDKKDINALKDLSENFIRNQEALKLFIERMEKYIRDHKLPSLNIL